MTGGPDMDGRPEPARFDQIAIDCVRHVPVTHRSVEKGKCSVELKQ